MYETRVDEIKELHNEANELSKKISESNTYPMSWEDRISDILSELFREEHTDWLIEQAEKAIKYEKSFAEYTDTLNQTRRKRDEVKNKLADALVTIKEQKKEIKYLQEELKKFGY